MIKGQTLRDQGAIPRKIKDVQPARVLWGFLGVFPNHLSLCFPRPSFHHEFWASPQQWELRCVIRSFGCMWRSSGPACGPWYTGARSQVPLSISFLISKILMIPTSHCAWEDQMGKAYENALEMPRFARVTVLIIKAHHPASPIGVFCCFFPPTILLTLPPNGFSEFRGEHFVSHSEDIWDTANTSLLRRKPCHLCSLPKMPRNQLGCFSSRRGFICCKLPGPRSSPHYIFSVLLEPSFYCGQPINTSSCFILRKSALPWDE